MKLYFIRHGQTDWNEAGKIQGSHDIDLNANGLRQAEELCRKLIEEGYPISSIYTSRQKRALQTAMMIGQAIAIKPIIIDGMEEVHLGHWEGLSWSEIQDQFPDEYKEWYHNRRYSKSHQGEAYQEVVERALTAIQTIIRDNTMDVAIVTHNAVIMCLQCYLTGTPFDEMKRFKSDNTAVTIIDADLFRKEATIPH